MMQRPARQVAPPRILCGGRTLISRAELARMSGCAPSTLACLYAARSKNGHPPALHRDPDHGGALYFDEQAALRWQRDREPRRPPARFSDQEGAPDELISTSEAARILGYHGPATIRAYLSRYPGYFPAPDQVQRTRGGRERKLWRRASIWAFAERLARSLSCGSHAPSAI